MDTETLIRIMVEMGLEDPAIRRRFRLGEIRLMEEWVAERG